MVPVSSVSGSVYFMIAGTWLFHERLPANADQLGLRLAAIVVAGLVLVTLARHGSAGTAEPAEPAAAPSARHARTRLADSGRQPWP
jgi:hypothetical protein